MILLVKNICQRFCYSGHSKHNLLTAFVTIGTLKHDFTCPKKMFTVFITQDTKKNTILDFHPNVIFPLLLCGEELDAKVWAKGEPHYSG